MIIQCAEKDECYILAKQGKAEEALKLCVPLFASSSTMADDSTVTSLRELVVTSYVQLLLQAHTDQGTKPIMAELE